MPASAPLPHPRSAPVPHAIALLRLAAMECRAGPRVPVAACALLDPKAGADAYAAALARALPGASERRPVIWRPGSDGLSFDETWLLALGDALARGDRASARFLTRRRVRPGAGATVAMLVAGLAARA